MPIQSIPNTPSESQPGEGRRDITPLLKFLLENTDTDSEQVIAAGFTWDDLFAAKASVRGFSYKFMPQGGWHIRVKQIMVRHAIRRERGLGQVLVRRFSRDPAAIIGVSQAFQDMFVTRGVYKTTWDGDLLSEIRTRLDIPLTNRAIEKAMAEIFPRSYKKEGGVYHLPGRYAAISAADSALHRAKEILANS